MALVGESWLDGLRARRGQRKIARTDHGLNEGMARPADRQQSDPEAVTTSGISLARGTTIVSGPGQKARARLSAIPGQSSTHLRAISIDAT